MTYPAHLTRPIVIRTRRETIALVVCAITATFALSYSVHSHRIVESGPPNQEWTGGLADLTSEPVVAPLSETITSASLVVPKSELALPPMPPVRALVRLRGCEGSVCKPKAASPAGVASSSQRRTAMIADETFADDGGVPTRLHERLSPPEKIKPSRAKPSLMSRMNPLNHLPDISTIKRPFASAGDTMTGWFKRF